METNEKWPAEGEWHDKLLIRSEAGEGGREGRERGRVERRSIPGGPHDQRQRQGRALTARRKKVEDRRSGWREEAGQTEERQTAANEPSGSEGRGRERERERESEGGREVN